MKIEKEESEVDKLLEECLSIESEVGTKFRGMTYERGIRAGIEWILGETDEEPLDE